MKILFLKYFSSLFISSGVQNHPNNDTENGKNHDSSALSYHDNTSPTVYSSNTVMTSFNNIEQSYTRVVGQVYSRETVTTIYRDPQTNFWVSCFTKKNGVFCSFTCGFIHFNTLNYDTAIRSSVN